MTSHPYTAGVTLLIVLLMFGTASNVGYARGRYGVKAPAVTGHPLFERALRIQMNTLEWAVMTLPCLWLFAAYLSDRGAAAIGGLWLAARIAYAIAYQREPASRGLPFLAASIAFGALGLGAGWGVLRALWFAS
ncbi:MAG: MAPEG family protein [Rhodocyclaceae bacterium]|nr:MAPEG family protein [Rhodocyclaceae bacterium]MBX3668692.1 MAPEG family protein [Rhodocyclaceae bacterium]